MKVQTLIEQTCARFEEAPLYYGHGTDNAWDEAVALVLGITGLADHPASLQTEIATPVQRQISELTQARIETRQPLAYLLGRWRYAGLEFEVAPGVIVPRSPLGLMLDDVGRQLRRPVATIADLCCGSGALGIVAAHVFPDAHLFFYDLDPRAIALTARNIDHHGLGHRTQLLTSDVTQAWEGPERFDLILCNPPYVNAEDMQDLPPEYRHEPVGALAAGDDGMSVMPSVLSQLPGRLSPHGLFLGEVGLSSEALCKRFPLAPFIWPELPSGGEGVFLLEGGHINSHTLSPSF